MNIGIVGSRRRDSQKDFDLLVNAFTAFCTERDLKPSDITIVSGGCKQGGDRFAELIINFFKLKKIIHYPDKSKLPENPQRWHFAGINYDRNTLIARDSDYLFAVVAKDRKGGTEDTVKKFVKFKKSKNNLILIEE